MKRKSFLFLLAVLFLLPTRAADAAPATSAKSMILVHPASGRVLAEKDAQVPLPIASTTKLMTALTAAENADPLTEAEIAPEWTGIEGSSMYLARGERYTVRELLEGLLLASGNDAAVALACVTAGDVSSFVGLMNEKCLALGMENTHFENPHGLDSAKHFSTARDLALLMTAVMKNDLLREILAETSCVIHGRTYENHNKLLRSCRGVSGGKTGYTMSAGRCLVSVCERDGLQLVCVTLSDPRDWSDHAALYDWAYSRFQFLHIPAGRTLCALPLVSGRVPEAELCIENDVSLCLKQEEIPEIICYLPPFAFAPLRKGDRLGTLLVKVDGKTAAEMPLVCNEICPRQSTAASTLRYTVDMLMGIYTI